MSTIKDVARLSGTSVGTVSRLLNGYQIKNENREKIEQAIKELDFTLNPIARGLKTSRTNTVGILIPQLSNIFSTRIIDGMERVFDEHGYSVLVCDSRNSISKEREKIRFLKDKLVDGIVVMPTGDDGEHISEILECQLPVVLVDRLLPNTFCDGVVSDNINGAYQAVESIINRGHRRIGIIAGPQAVYTAKERLEGYIRAVRDYNIEIDEELITYSEYTVEGGAAAFEKLLSLNNPPTAIFASNYEITVGTVKSIIEKGMKIGDDISVFGYDQLELSKVFTPELSVVVHPMDMIGQRAAETLIKRMKGDNTGLPVVSRLKTQLVITDSIKKLL
jgi:LacI family transcriptional regulator